MARKVIAENTSASRLLSEIVIDPRARR